MDTLNAIDPFTTDQGRIQFIKRHLPRVYQERKREAYRASHPVLRPVHPLQKEEDGEQIEDATKKMVNPNAINLHQKRLL